MKVIADGTKPLYMRMLLQPGQGAVICTEPNDIRLIESICVYFMENAETPNDYAQWSGLYESIRISHAPEEEQ